MSPVIQKHDKLSLLQFNNNNSGNNLPNYWYDLVKSNVNMLNNKDKLKLQQKDIH